MGFEEAVYLARYEWNWAYVKGCLECQRMRKGSAGKIPMGKMPIHDILFNNLAIDIVGPFPRLRVLSSCLHTYALPPDTLRPYP